MSDHLRDDLKPLVDAIKESMDVRGILEMLRDRTHHLANTSQQILTATSLHTAQLNQINGSLADHELRVRSIEGLAPTQQLLANDREHEELHLKIDAQTVDMRGFTTRIDLRLEELSRDLVGRASITAYRRALWVALTAGVGLSVGILGLIAGIVRIG